MKTHLKVLVLGLPITLLLIILFSGVMLTYRQPSVMAPVTTSISPLPQPQPTVTTWGELISPLPTPVQELPFDVRAAASTAVQLYFPSKNKEFQILLQRKVKSSEFPLLGLDQVSFLQESPMELVLLQGKFDTTSMGRGTLNQPAEYLVFVFNLDTRTITYMTASAKGDNLQPLLALAAQANPTPVTPVTATSIPVAP